MKKLIKFQPTAKTYFDIAEDKYDEGDYVSAVHYFYQSYLKHHDVGSLVALGETYIDMGEPERGLKYLLMALDRDFDNPDIRERIAECFLDLDEEETAFFYFRPDMSAKRFKQIMEDCDNDNEFLPRPPIRVLEKDDNVALSIALKLLQSGDISYAKEILLTIKPESENFGDACNLLALTALEGGEPQKALEYAAKSLEKRDNIDGRCDMMMAYHALKDTENMQKAADALEALRPKIDEQKTIAFAFIKIGDAKRAIKHLRVLYDAGMMNRDMLVSYALALQQDGQKEKARQMMIKAVRLYPEDVTVKTLAAGLAQERDMGFYPFLPEDIAREFSDELEKKLAFLKETANELKETANEAENNSVNEDKDGSLAKCGKDGEAAVAEDFFEDESFNEKVKWIFQGGFSLNQGRAALILGRHKRWHPFLREQLLDNYLDLPAKKSCLFALLLFGGREKIGIVLDGLLMRLKPRYPEGMDIRFRTAYCLAFSTFMFSDSDFESRLFATASKLLKKYQQHKDILTSEDVLAAVIFFAAGHNKITDSVNCAHLFGCDADKMKQYLLCLGVNTAK